MLFYASLLTISFTLLILELFIDFKENKKIIINKYFIASNILYFAFYSVGVFLTFNLIPDLSVAKQIYTFSNVINSIIIFILVFIISGLVDYLFHRFINHSGTFWWTHEYHHIPNRVSLYMPGIFFRPFSFLSTNIVNISTFATYIALSEFFSYYNPYILISVFFVQFLILLVSHSSTLYNLSHFSEALRFLQLSNPKDHLLHHSYSTNYANFGNLTIIWDKIFNTYQKHNMNMVYKVGNKIQKDYAESVTFGFLSFKKYLNKD